MGNFAIEVHKSPDAGLDDPHALAIRANDVVFTRLLRPGTEQPDDYLLAPPVALAFWLVDNWWRLRWECVPPDSRLPEWRLAHEMASIGGGYVWPRLTIWGEGQRIGLECRSDPPGVVGPVRYVTDALTFMAGEKYESAVDVFLATVVDTGNGFGSDRTALKAQWEALVAERQDPEMAAWRRLEAQSGYDPDTAPENLMTDLAELADQFGESGIEEAVQARPGSAAAEVLSQEVTATRESGVICDFSNVLHTVGSSGVHRESRPPWQMAEEAGARVRKALGIGTGPVSNAELAALIDTDVEALKSTMLPSHAPYGLRLKSHGSRTDRVALRSRGPASRRFELSRAIGDAIWGGGDALGPIARSKTARQKFQRAFAQNLLCPASDLMGYIGTSEPNDDDVEAAAKYFDVSERVVQTTLVNSGVIARERFEDMVEAA